MPYRKYQMASEDGAGWHHKYEKFVVAPIDDEEFIHCDVGVELPKHEDECEFEVESIVFHSRIYRNPAYFQCRDFFEWVERKCAGRVILETHKWTDYSGQYSDTGSDRYNTKYVVNIKFIKGSDKMLFMMDYMSYGQNSI